ncbi:glycosyltransferase group 2 family protein [groundwater metagenome]
MISVVVPFYDEEESIEPLYEQLSSVLNSLNRKYEIIFVDDDSTDNTFKNMLKVREKDKSVKIIKFRKNFGQSAALKAGFDHAKGNIVVSIDGDLQNDPADIQKLIEKIEKEDYDVVCGWRADRKDPLFKKAISKLANLVRRNITSELVHDSGCTFRAYSRECVKNLDLYGETHRYIPAMLLWRGYRIGEVKVRHNPRKYGTTKYGWQRIIKGFLDLIVISFLLGTYMGIERLFFGRGLSDRPLFLLAILMVIIGVQFIVSGILADIMLKVYYGQNERKNYLIERVVG